MAHVGVAAARRLGLDRLAVGIARIDRALQEAVQHAAGRIERQAFHAAVGAALGQHGRQVGGAGAGRVLLLDQAGGDVQARDEGAVLVAGPQHVARLVEHQRLGVEAVGVVAGLGFVELVLVGQRGLAGRAHARARRQAGDLGVGVALERHAGAEHRAGLAHAHDAEARRERRCREHLADAGDTVAAAGHGRGRAVAVRAAVGDGVELERAVVGFALERQARAVGRQEALRKVGLDVRVVALVGHVEAGVGLQLVARDGDADGAELVRLRRRLGDRCGQARGQRVLEVFAGQHAAVRVDHAGIVGSGQRGQHRVERGVEGVGRGVEIERAGRQRGLERGRQADAVGGVAVLVEALQREQAVDHGIGLHVAAAGQGEWRDCFAACGAAQGQRAGAEGDGLAVLAGELALGVGGGLGGAAGHVVEAFHRGIEEGAGLRLCSGRIGGAATAHGERPAAPAAVAAAAGGQHRASAHERQPSHPRSSCCLAHCLLSL
ncbi:hypothetical protein FQZ97_728380 [compost metagenome]